MFCLSSNANLAPFLYKNYDQLNNFDSPDPLLATTLLNYLSAKYVNNWIIYCNFTKPKYQIKLEFNNEGVVCNNNVKEIFEQDQSHFSDFLILIIPYSIVILFLISLCFCTFCYPIKCVYDAKQYTKEDNIQITYVKDVQQSLDDEIEVSISEREQMLERKIENYIETVNEQYMLVLSNINYLNHLSEFEKRQEEFEKEKELKQQ
jgi:hypothetical protein